MLVLVMIACTDQAVPDPGLVPTSPANPQTSDFNIPSASTTISASPTSKLLLPDLVSGALSDLFIVTNGETGERKLFFSTTVANIGDGPLEMKGVYDEKMDQIRAIQHIETENGAVTEREVGYFVFHEAHDHWHFEDFSMLEIFSLNSEGLPDKLMASTGKTTFCLQDSARLPSLVPNSPETAKYGGCDDLVQGISAGWEDLYDFTLPGQQLNIENLAEDRYMIRLTADPVDLILENNEDNNIAIAFVEIGRRPTTVTQPSTIIPLELNIEKLAGNLDVPWAIDFAPDGRMFLTERSGRIRIIEDGLLQDESWMSLEVAAVGEGGLLGLAVDPDFSRNHFIYVVYTYRNGSELRNRLVRLREDSSTGKGVLDLVLVDDVPGGSIHNGGRLKFGPDGKLYWATGETGEPDLSQDLSSLGGKILRLNPRWNNS